MFDSEIGWYIKFFLGIPLGLWAVWMTFCWVWYAFTGDWLGAPPGDPCVGPQGDLAC